MPVIDTNVYSALVKGLSAARIALQGESSISLPIMVVAELKYGFIHGMKQVENEERLNRFLAQDRVTMLYPSLKTAELYAELSVYCRRAGRALSHNDIWIAALAQEADVPLVTYDKDFEVFRDIFHEKLVLLVESTVS